MPEKPITEYAAEDFPVPEGALWTRLEAETPKAWKAYQHYRDLGPSRSMAKTNDFMGYAPTTVSLLKKWAKQYEWARRVAAYDEWLDRQRVGIMTARNRTRAIEAAERWADLAESGQSAYTLLLQELERRISQGEGLDIKMDDAELLERILLAAPKIRALQDMERLALGEPLQTHHVEGNVRHEASLDALDEAIKDNAAIKALEDAIAQLD